MRPAERTAASGRTSQARYARLFQPIHVFPNQPGVTVTRLEGWPRRNLSARGRIAVVRTLAGLPVRASLRGAVHTRQQCWQKFTRQSIDAFSQTLMSPEWPSYFGALFQ